MEKTAILFWPASKSVMLCLYPGTVAGHIALQVALDNPLVRAGGRDVRHNLCDSAVCAGEPVSNAFALGGLIAERCIPQGQAVSCFVP